MPVAAEAGPRRHDPTVLADRAQWPQSEAETVKYWISNLSADIPAKDSSASRKLDGASSTITGSSEPP